MTLFDDLYNIFIRPIADAVASFLKPITDIITPEKAAEEAKKAEGAFENTLGAKQLGFATSSPGVPEDLARQASDQLGPIEGALMAQVTSNIVAEAASLGQVDITLNELSNTPAINASKATAMDIRRAEFTEGVYPALRRYHLKHFLPMIPESYRLALAISRGIIDVGKYFEAMAESGLSNEWAVIWAEQNYVYPNPAQSFELLWRGVIDEATLSLILARNGFRDDMAEYIKALRFLIPPASDIITMVVREAFEEQFVTPAPDIFADYMTKKGYSKEWADRYWTAHWVPIPLGQAYANLHRGYWDKERFMTALRIADLHPTWRDDVYNVAYNPPSIRELGYGYDVGAYSVADIIRYRRWGGLSQEDAEKAGTAMVAYRTEAERGAVRTEYMYLYGRGKIHRGEFESKLIELGTPAPAVALWLERADAYKIRVTAEPTPEEPPSMTRSIAQWLFEHNVRTETWLKSTLADLGYLPATIEDYVAQSRYKMAETQAKAAEVKYRALTLTQIRDLFALGYIEYGRLPDALVEIGYARETAVKLAELMVYTVAQKVEPTRLSRTDIVRLYEYKLLGVDAADILRILQHIVTTEGPNSPTNALYEEFLALGYEADNAAYLTVWTAIDVSLPTLKAQYSKGWITATDMYNQLVAIGLPQEKANELMTTIVKAEAGERTTAEKDLTKAEIIKGAKTGILSPTQASELLQGIGYDEHEAVYLLYINAVVARGDPEGYWEMRKVIEQQKKATGQPHKDIPDDLIMLELQLKDAKGTLEQLKATKASEEAIGAHAVAVADIETRMRVVIAKLQLQ